MAEVASAYVALLPSFRGGKSAISKELGGPLDAAGQDGGKRFGGGMRAGIAGIATKVFAPLAAAAGGVALGGFLKGAIEEASGLTESINALDVVFGEASGGAQELGKAASGALGLSNLDFNNLAVQFSNFAKNIAGEGGDVTGTLESITTRAADFASVMNLDVAEAATLFQSGLAGETEPLRRFGIDLSAAAVEAYALENGIASSAGSMTEAEKVQARYGLLMQSTAQTAGDFANTSGSLANQQRILGASWSNITATLGAAFLPMVSSVVSFINERVMPTLATFAGGVQGLSALIFEGDFTGALTEAFGWEEDSGIVGGILDIREAFQSGGLLEAAQAAFGALVDWLSSGGVTTIATALVDGRERLFDAAMQIFPALVDAAVTVLPGLVTFLTGTLIPGIVTLVVTSAPMLLAAAVELFSSLIEGIAEVLPTVVDALAGLLPVVVGSLLGMIPTLLPIALDLFTTLVTAVTTVLPALITTLIGMLPTLVTTILGMLPGILQAGIGLFLSLVTAVLDVLPHLITTLLGVLLPQLLTTILTMLPELLTTAIDLFLALLDAVLEVLPQLIELLIGTVLPTLLTTVLGMLPELLVAAVTVFMALLTGIIRVLPQLVGFLIGTLIPTIVRSVGQLAGALLPEGRKALEGLGDGISRAWPAVRDWFGRLPQMVLSALGNVGRWLFESGKSIVQGLIDGIKNMAGGIGDAIGDALADARNLLPFSPAKEGPFSGKGWTLYSGRSIVQGLADGIADERSTLVAETQRTMAAARAGLGGGLRGSLRADVGAVGYGAGSGVTQNIYPTPGMSEQQVADYAARRLGRELMLR